MYEMCSQINENWSSEGHCTSSQGLNIINLHTIYNPVTGPKQQIFVVLCVQYQTKNGGKDHESKQSSTTPDTGYQMGQ